jgi:hypothetical protein
LPPEQGGLVLFLAIQTIVFFGLHDMLFIGHKTGRQYTCKPQADFGCSAGNTGGKSQGQDFLLIGFEESAFQA